MAKRDIPEINAGSMADIAFLLLIFFLVTTTMDRDKAYIRPIPKKVEIPETQEPIMERDILAIEANSSNQLMVRGELVQNTDDISDLVLEFFRKNEDLSPEETLKAATNKNHPGFDFPFYNHFTMSEIDREIEKATEKAVEIDETPGAEDSFKEFYWSKVDEWKKRKKALTLYGKSRLPELSQQAHIRIVVQKKTGYEYFAKIHSEIEEALFELRDEASKDLWGFGYGRIVTRLGSEPTDEEYIEKKKLLEALYPSRIIEVTPKI